MPASHGWFAGGSRGLALSLTLPTFPLQENNKILLVHSVKFLFNNDLEGPEVEVCVRLCDGSDEVIA